MLLSRVQVATNLHAIHVAIHCFSILKSKIGLVLAHNIKQTAQKADKLTAA